MARYAFVVSACTQYTVELVALLNSLDYVGNQEDVHVFWCSRSDKKEFISQVNKLNYKCIIHEVPQQEIEDAHGVSEITCRKRYWYAAEVGKDYDAVCVLDADMIFFRNPINFFEIAAKTGLILCAVKEQKESYGHPNHQFKGQWLMPEGFTPEFDFCNCPMFVDTKIWGEAFRESFRIFVDGWGIDNFKAPDMAAVNICLAKHGSQGRSIAMPNVQWISSNEQALKFYQRFVGDYDSVKTETGTPVYSVHGHIGHVQWRANQLVNRHQCAQGYCKASGESLLASDNIASGSMELIYSRFKKMFHHKIKIEPFNYRHPEEDYKLEYGDLWD